MSLWCICIPGAGARADGAAPTLILKLVLLLELVAVLVLELAL